MWDLTTMAIMCYVSYLLLLRERQSQYLVIIMRAQSVTFITMVLPPACVNGSRQCCLATCHDGIESYA